MPSTITTYSRVFAIGVKIGYAYIFRPMMCNKQEQAFANENYVPGQCCNLKTIRRVLIIAAVFLHLQITHLI